jgi:hypothetical protein
METKRRIERTKIAASAARLESPAVLFDSGRNMKSIRRAVASAVLFVVFVAALGAQTTGQIRGTVIDEAGKPLEGVKVVATSTASGARTFTTGKNGGFRFAVVPPGNYVVSFTRKDYADVQKSATVRLDGTVTVDAKMFRISG